MPDVFDENGLQLKTLTESTEELGDNFKTIYGEDINIEQNSPDGQMINIFSQAATDLREVLENINAGFDPDQAEGRVLDQRVALNNIQRNGGTFTLVPVVVTVDRAVSLVGLDDQSDEITPDIENLYTVKDDNENEYYLLESVDIVSAGANELTFRAAEIGNVQVSVNTITTPVTVIAGVVSINNTSGASVQGVDEESDADLKERRRISTSISAIGYLDAIEAAIKNISDVSAAVVLENDTDAVDSNGIPAHSIWAIVEGGDNTEIANTIYAKKSSGSGMKGDVEVEVERPNGTTKTIKFDRPTDEELYVQFSIALPNGGSIDTENLKSQIVENVTFDVGADAAGSTITAFLLSINSKYQVSGMELSKDDITYLEIVSPTAAGNRFVMSVDRISIA